MAETTDGPTRDGQGSSLAGDRERKLARLRERLLERPSDAAALSRAAALLYEMGRFREAAAHFGRALSCFPCPLGQGDPERGCRLPASARPGQQTDELHYGLLLRLGDCHAACRELQRAGMYYRAASALSPRRAEPYICLGTLALQSNDLDEAQRQFEAATVAQPESSEAHCGSAAVHQHRGRYSEAFETYLKSLELDANNLVALLGLFQASCQMGTFAKIIHYLETYLKGHPDDGSVRFCLATLYAREGRLAEAKRAVLAVLEQQPKQEAEKLLAEIEEAMAESDERQGAAT